MYESFHYLTNSLTVYSSFTIKMIQPHHVFAPYLNDFVYMILNYELIFGFTGKSAKSY